MWGVTPDNIYTAGLFFLTQTSHFISTIACGKFCFLFFTVLFYEVYNDRDCIALLRCGHGVYIFLSVGIELIHSVNRFSSSMTMEKPWLSKL